MMEAHVLTLLGSILSIDHCYSIEWTSISSLLEIDFDIATVTHRDVCDTVASGEGHTFGYDVQLTGTHELL